MRFVSVGKNRQAVEVPETWAEAEAMLTQAMRYHTGPGGNTAQRAVIGNVAFGMFGDRWMCADPTQALMYLMQSICQRKGAGLDR
jgi:hypothetical protein